MLIQIYIKLVAISYQQVCVPIFADKSPEIKISDVRSLHLFLLYRYLFIFCI